MNDMVIMVAEDPDTLAENAKLQGEISQLKKEIVQMKQKSGDKDDEIYQFSLTLEQMEQKSGQKDIEMKRLKQTLEQKQIEIKKLKQQMEEMNQVMETDMDEKSEKIREMEAEMVHDKEVIFNLDHANKTLLIRQSSMDHCISQLSDKLEELAWKNHCIHRIFEEIESDNMVGLMSIIEKCEQDFFCPGFTKLWQGTVTLMINEQLQRLKEKVMNQLEKMGKHVNEKDDFPSIIKEGWRAGIIKDQDASKFMTLQRDRNNKIHYKREDKWLDMDHIIYVWPDLIDALKQ